MQFRKNVIDDIYIVCEVDVFGSASDPLGMVVSGMSESDKVLAGLGFF